MTAISAPPVPADSTRLRDGFSPDLFITDPDITASYARDRTGAYVGTPFAVARPRTAADLSAIMIRCGELDLGVVPQGGLTGLVGAGVSGGIDPEVVVILDRMSAVRSVDPVGYAMVVEAGCILETAKQAADAQDCLLPITFGSQGSARIGGNVSTNAGGFNVLRYGMTRDLVLGLEVVLPDGRIWDGLRTLRKDNRGYDLKQLFIGAEGTLGIVTAAALKLFPKPTQVETALLGLRSVEDVMSFSRPGHGQSRGLSAGGPAHCLRPHRRRQHSPQRGPTGRLDDRPAASAVPACRGRHLRHARPLRRQHQRRARHWPFQEAGLPGTGRSRDPRLVQDAKEGYRPGTPAEQGAHLRRLRSYLGIRPAGAACGFEPGL